MSMNFEPDGRLRVFCSLPMSGKSDDQIKKAIQSMHAWFFLTQTVENGRNYRTDEIAWVDNFDFIPVHPLIPVKVPSTKTRAYCLGEALKISANDGRIFQTGEDTFIIAGGDAVTEYNIKTDEKVQFVKNYPQFKPLIESIVFRDENLDVVKVVPIDEYLAEN